MSNNQIKQETPGAQSAGKPAEETAAPVEGAYKDKTALRHKTGRWNEEQTRKMELAPVEVADSAVESVLVVAGSLGYESSLESLAKGAWAPIAMENGEVTERGMNRVRCGVAFLSGLMDGMKHKEAMKAAGMTWAQVNAFNVACPAFDEMYQNARRKMKHAMGTTILDTAFELATEGADVFNKKGEFVGKRKSEKMLDKLLVMSGKEFRKEGNGLATRDKGTGGGGLTINLHFDGKKSGGNVETIDVQ